MRFSTKSRLLAGAKAALLMAALGGVYGLYTRFETLASDGSVISGTLQKSEALYSVAVQWKAGPAPANWKNSFKAAYFELGAAISGAELNLPSNAAAFKVITADYFRLLPLAEKVSRSEADKEAGDRAWAGLVRHTDRILTQALAAAGSTTEARNLLLAKTGLGYLAIFIFFILAEIAHYYLAYDPLIDELSKLNRKLMRCAAPFPDQPAFGNEILELNAGADRLRAALHAASEERARLKKEAATRQARMKAQSRSLELTRKKVVELVDALEDARVELQNDKKALKAAGEKLERSNRELEQFAYVASHDLKEPLRVISSFSGLLSKRYSEQLDADAKDFIHYITQGSQRASDLISALFNYSKVTYTSKAFRPLPTEEILQKAMFNLKISLEEKRARITWKDLPVIKGDEFQLIQLFQNLISNSLKFNAAPEPEISLSASSLPGSVTIRVSDNGIGIPKEHTERVFLIFQRLHSQEKYPGTGIGLALCKKIAENHGGRIWVEQNPAEGSSFFIQFPVREPALSDTPTQQEAKAGI